MRLPRLSRIGFPGAQHICTRRQKIFRLCRNNPEKFVRSEYLAAKGSNQGYVLMHSTGSLPHGSEIDVPLNYADYYYMEALKRYIDLKIKGKG